MRIAVLHSGELVPDGTSMRLMLPYPSLSGHQGTGVPGGEVVWLGDAEEIPQSLAPLHPASVREEDAAMLFSGGQKPAAIAWRRQRTRPGSALIRLLRSRRISRSVPFIVYGIEEKAVSLSVALGGGGAGGEDEGAILLMPHLPQLEKLLADFGRVSDGLSAEEILTENESARFVVLSAADSTLVTALRRSRRFSAVPIMIVRDSFTEDEINSIADVPNLLVVNSAVLEAPEFMERLVSVLSGGELLPPLTGALVKRAIAYINRHLPQQFSRWQLAESVNISEDYLTRIFRREMGVSPWDYLARCRVGAASELLLGSGVPLSEVALASGFQDQAYFSRVFRRIKGCTPGQFRQRD